MLHDLGEPIGVGEAGGKVILCGEHAVVYGRPALAVPLTGLRSRARVWSGDRLRIVLPDLQAEVGAEQDHPLVRLVRAAASLGRLETEPTWTIEVASEIPQGRGLGSSASVAVALARAIGDATGASFQAAELAEIAMHSERVVHARASGIDPATIAYDAPILFTPDEEPTEIRPRRAAVFLVGDTGESAATKVMVEAVSQRLDANPSAGQRWLKQIGELTREAAVGLERGDLSRLGRAMNSNHLVLQALGVSTPALDRLVGAARSAGALGAKLSGSGGGGVMIALVERAAEIGVEESTAAASGAETGARAVETAAASGADAGARAVETALLAAGAAAVYRARVQAVSLAKSGREA